MPVWMKAAGKWGGILVLIALLISLLKTIITFIGFLTGAIKILIILIFAALIIGIGIMLIKGWKEARRNRD
jgi:predicted transporter